MREKFKEILSISVIEQDAIFYLRQQQKPADCIIDNGFSHCVTNTETRSELFKLIYNNLKPSGFYVITHFSEKETLSKEHFQTNLDNLKNNFPKNKWREVLPWAEITWKRNDGKMHYAYTAILERKFP